MTEPSTQTDAAPARIAPVSSTPTTVTLYEDRAEVVRRADGVALEPGVVWVALDGVTPFVDDRSVQVHIHPTETIELDAVRVTGARVRREVLLPQDYAAEAIAELEGARDDARAEAAAARAGLRRLEARRGRLEHLRAQWFDGLATVPRGLGEAETRAAWRENGAAIAADLADALAEITAQRESIDLAEERAASAATRLQVRRAEQPRVLARIEIQVASRIATVVELEVVYRTPCAAWRPEHIAKVDALDDRPLVADAYADAPANTAAASIEATIEIVTLATIWQETGERWDDVELVLSTARPGRAASPPPLEDDWVVSRKKSAEERQHIVIESRDQTIESTGVAGGRAVDEMPGVDDGGEPLRFVAPERVTLESTGEPVRVPIHAVDLDATLTRVLRPERSPVAHIRAEAIHRGPIPILAGPIQVVRGETMMGRSRIDFVATGAPFELGFGPDDAIRVRRRTQHERDSTITGAQVVDVTVDLFLSNLSEVARHVTVVERAPVSEIDGLAIRVREAHGFDHDERTGHLSCPLVLGAGATEELTVVFRVKAPAKMVLPF